MTMMALVFWMGGAIAAEEKGWGFYPAMFWPYYAGKAVFAALFNDGR